MQKWTSSAPDLLPQKEKRKEVLGILSIYKYVLLFMVYLES